eukprot:957143-Prymnesium_polylepis.1
MARVRDARATRAGSHAEVMHQAGASTARGAAFPHGDWGRLRTTGGPPFAPMHAPGHPLGGCPPSKPAR